MSRRSSSMSCLYQNLQLVLVLLVVLTSPMSVARAQGDNSTTSDVSDDNNIHYVTFNVQLDANTTDSFTVEVHNDWAPLGAARFLELVDTTTPAPFFAQVRFFRVLTNFVAQFGISGDPAVSAAWRDKNLPDDPVVASNTRGSLTFAMGGVDTRTTQIFVNLQDNKRLDGMGFAPFAKVVSGMQVVDKLYAGYGEGAPDGNGPDQSRIQEEGNAYLEQDFPLLSYILSAERVSKPSAEPAATLSPSDSDVQGSQPSQSESQTSQASGNARSTVKRAFVLWSSILAIVVQAIV